MNYESLPAMQQGEVFEVNKGVLMSCELVSVIVPTKNSVDTIETCLKSISNQTYCDIEIIVIDNYSNDGTADISRKYGAKVFLKDSERSEARNYGAKNAKGNYLVFIDSDMELTPKVIEDSLHEISKDSLGAVIIPEISVGEGFWTQCKVLERSCYIGDDTIEAARFFGKSVFLEIGGYDEKLICGEDWDLSQKVKNAKYKISRINSLIKHHEGRLSLIKTMKKKYYYAKTLSYYIKKNPEMAKKQMVLIRPAYFRHWKRLIRDPIHTAGFIFMKSCEFAAGGAGCLKKMVYKKI